MAPEQPDLEQDAEPTPAELARAKAFGSLVDKTLAGRTPAAMDSEDRALLETATVIRAVAGNAELSSAKQRSVVEAALRQAVGGGAVSAAIPITRARVKRTPWIVAAASMLVAAAAILLWLRAPRQITVTTVRAAVPETWKSRPADPLVGPIGREHAGEASARLDAIFADRLEGYRERRLQGGKP